MTPAPVSQYSGLTVPAASGPPSKDGIAARMALYSTLLEKYKADYAELGDAWKAIDTKSQATLGITGVMIGAAYAFLRDGLDTMPLTEKHLLVAAVMLLAAALFLALASLWPRRVDAPHLSSQLDDQVTHLASASDEDLQQRMPAFVHDQVAVWKLAVAATRPFVASKALLLRLSQTVFGIAFLLIAVLGLVRLL